MATINYKKFDEQAYFKAELKGKTKRTVRESIETLKRNGFRPVNIGKNATSKLPTIWTNGRGIIATIV